MDDTERDWAVWRWRKLAEFGTRRHGERWAGTRFIESRVRIPPPPPANGLFLKRNYPYANCLNLSDAWDGSCDGKAAQRDCIGAHCGIVRAALSDVHARRALFQWW